MLNDFQNKKLKEDGIIKIENFITEDEIQDLKKIINYYSATKSSKNSYWPTNNYLLFHEDNEYLLMLHYNLYFLSSLANIQ